MPGNAKLALATMEFHLKFFNTSYIVFFLNCAHRSAYELINFIHNVCLNFYSFKSRYFQALSLANFKHKKIIMSFYGLVKYCYSLWRDSLFMFS